jgi:hypothetical protein
MQKREKILAIVLAAVVFGWIGLPMLESQFLAPLKELESRQIRLTDETERLHKQQLELALKDEQTRQWRSRSLPPDPLNAQRLYQEWLTNLAQLSGFSDIKITLERRVAEGTTYVTIPVTLESRARLQELVRFLERFHSVDLLHRIARCDVASPSNEGDPELSVTLLAEGLAIQSAPERTRLFPQTELFEAVDKEADRITVVSNKGFPQAVPFRIRMGNEFLDVTAMDDNVWTVQRGVERTFAEPHSGNTGVEQFPLRANGEVAEATAIWMHSPFTKPAPAIEFRPRLASTSPPPAIRDRDWSWKLDIAGWNPAFGSPNYELLAAPAGMELDERSGLLRWHPTAQVERGEHSVQVLVWGTNGRDAGFTPTFRVKVRDPNQPPRIAQPEALRFFIGRQSNVRIAAEDPDGNTQQLKFVLEEGPGGMTIDPASGQLSWTPGDDLAPQEFTIRVKATDSDDLPESAVVRIPVILQEDSARFTYLTGSVTRSDGAKEAWLYDRSSNRTARLHEGERFRIADLDLILESIGPTSVILRRNDQRYQLRFEQPLLEMALLAQPAETSNSPKKTTEEAAPMTAPPATAPAPSVDSSPQ